MAAISELITKYNILDNGNLSSADAEPIARWITSMVNTFGLNGTATPDAQEIGWSGVDIPDEAKPYLYPLSSIRDSLRSAARSKETLTSASIQQIIATKSPTTENGTTTNQYSTVLSTFQSSISSLPESPSLPKEILSLCDRVRDVDLWDIGIYLEDRENQPALVRPVTKSLIEAREDKAARLRQKQGQKQAEKEARDAEAKAKADKGKLSHLDMFKTEEFSAWDEDGVPTKDKEGTEIAKSRAKKLRKDWERQRKAHEAWKEGNPS
jgi:cysteinyl-tRNA synthetase